MKDPGPDAVTMTLVPVKGAQPHYLHRLKRMLKAMLRGYGFRCVSVGPASVRAVSHQLLDEMPAIARAASGEEAA
jgi:hypothetical protein